jgi:hypothetical protein
MGVGSQRHAPATLPPGKSLGTHCIGGWVGLRAGPDGCGKTRPHRDYPVAIIVYKSTPFSVFLNPGL